MTVAPVAVSARQDIRTHTGLHPFRDRAARTVRAYLTEGHLMLTAGYDVPTDVLTHPERLEAVAQLMPRTEQAPAALQHFVSHVATALGAPCTGVSLILNDAGVLAATHGVSGWLTEVGGMPAEWAPCAVVVRHNAPLLITDTHDDPAHTTNPLVMITGVRSYAGVPLHLHGQPVGSLCVLSGEPDAFTDTNLQTLLGLAPRAVELLRDAARD